MRALPPPPPWPPPPTAAAGCFALQGFAWRQTQLSMGITFPLFLRFIKCSIPPSSLESLLDDSTEVGPGFMFKIIITWANIPISFPLQTCPPTMQTVQFQANIIPYGYGQRWHLKVIPRKNLLSQLPLQRIHICEWLNGWAALKISSEWYYFLLIDCSLIVWREKTIPLLKWKGWMANFSIQFWNLIKLPINCISRGGYMFRIVRSQ